MQCFRFVFRVLFNKISWNNASKDLACFGFSLFLDHIAKQNSQYVDVVKLNLLFFLQSMLYSGLHKQGFLDPAKLYFKRLGPFFALRKEALASGELFFSGKSNTNIKEAAIIKLGLKHFFSSTGKLTLKENGFSVNSLSLKNFVALFSKSLRFL